MVKLVYALLKVLTIKHLHGHAADALLSKLYYPMMNFEMVQGYDFRSSALFQ